MTIGEFTCQETVPNLHSTPANPQVRQVHNLPVPGILKKHHSRSHGVLEVSALVLRAAADFNPFHGEQSARSLSLSSHKKSSNKTKCHRVQTNCACADKQQPDTRIDVNELYSLTQQQDCCTMTAIVQGGQRPVVGRICAHEHRDIKILSQTTI